MEEFDLLKKLEKVKAPPGFEQKVMAQVSLRKRRQAARPAAWRWSLAGALATLLVGFVLLNVFVLEKKAPTEISQTKKYAPAAAGTVASSAAPIVPVIETLDYSTEVRGRSMGVPTIYLLEQVSEKTSKDILY